MLSGYASYFYIVLGMHDVNGNRKGSHFHELAETRKLLSKALRYCGRGPIYGKTTKFTSLFSFGTVMHEY